jgi:hypothetical protein
MRNGSSVENITIFQTLAIKGLKPPKTASIPYLISAFRAMKQNVSSIETGSSNISRREIASLGKPSLLITFLNNRLI